MKVTQLMKNAITTPMRVQTVIIVFHACLIFTPVSSALPLTARLTLYQEAHLMLKVEVFQLLPSWPELLRSVFTSGNL